MANFAISVGYWLLATGFLLALVVTLPAAAQRAPAVNPGVEEFRQRLERVTVAAASSDAAVRTRAVKTLAVLQQTLLDTLAAHADDPDPEVRARVAVLLAEIERDIQETHAVSVLGPALRQKFDKLRRARPDLCRTMLGLSENAKLAALRDIRRTTDRDRLHEPLALLGLFSRHTAVQDSAIEAVMLSTYTDPQIVHRLADLALGVRPTVGTIAPSTRAQAMHALHKLASPHAAGRLAAAACDVTRRFHTDRLALADAAVATGDKRLLLALLPKLNDTKSYSTFTTEAGPFTAAGSDIALYMLLKLTGQPLETYGLRLTSDGSPNTFLGFDSAKTRAAAVATYKTWWEQNKTQEKYKTIRPTPLPADNNNTVEFVD